MKSFASSLRSPFSFVALASLLAVACSSKGDPPPTGAAPQADSRCAYLLVDVPATCRTCEQAECCDAIAWCQAQTECSNLYACVDGCGVGDVACQLACSNQHPGGVGTYHTLLRCFDAARRCDEACGAAPPGDAGAD